MPLTLYVDGPAWRARLRSVVAASPGIVPVAKGNGYGLGLGRLARRCDWLGIDMMAVGTYAELPEVLSRFAGDVLVLEPYREFHDADLTHPRGADGRVVHTVGRRSDLPEIAARSSRRPRVVLEALTPMRRHGLDAAGLVTALGDHPGVRVEGLTLHLPLDVPPSGSTVESPGEERGRHGHLDDVEQWLSTVSAAGLGERAPSTWFLSHVTDAELVTLTRRHPEHRFRPRVGTHLWLGAAGEEGGLDALAPRATVTDRHRVAKGDRIGYRQRRIGKDGWVLVVSGGTSHGIGLEAPSPAVSVRQRATRLARGGLESAGRALSPFIVDGRRRWFVEPPHMQVSMVFVPSDVAVPEVGSEIAVRVRYTTTLFDRIIVS